MTEMFNNEKENGMTEPTQFPDGFKRFSDLIHELDRIAQETGPIGDPQEEEAVDRLAEMVEAWPREDVAFGLVLSMLLFEAFQKALGIRDTVEAFQKALKDQDTEKL